jgi:hypothetical protein
MSDEDDPPPQFPLYVRVLAVLYVLSPIFGFGGLFLFGGIGLVLLQIRGAIDETIVEFFVAGVGCPVITSAFRRWFPAWGRKNWPEGKPDDF